MPQVPATAVKAIDVLRVEKVRSADGLGERFGAARSGDEVDVVRHEAVGVDGEAEAIGLPLENLQVHAIVGVDEEDVLAVVATLGDVMRPVRDDNSCDSWHD